MSYNKKSILVEVRVYRLYIKSSKWNDTLQWLISWLTLHTAALFVLFSTLNVLFVCDDVGIKLEWDWIEFWDQLALILDTQHISIICQGLYSPHLRWHHELNCYFIMPCWVLRHLHLQQKFLSHSQHSLDSVLWRTGQWEWVWVSWGQFVPVESYQIWRSWFSGSGSIIFKDAHIVGIVVLGHKITNRALHDASLAHVLAVLWVLGLFGSPDILALLLVDLGPVLLLALLSTVGDHVAPYTFPQRSLLRLPPIVQLTVGTEVVNRNLRWKYSIERVFW